VTIDVTPAALTVEDDHRLKEGTAAVGVAE